MTRELQTLDPPTQPKSLRWSLLPLKLLYFNFGRAYLFESPSSKEYIPNLMPRWHDIDKTYYYWQKRCSLKWVKQFGWEVMQERTTLFKPRDSNLLNTYLYVHMFDFYWIQPSGNGGGYDNDGSPKIVGNLSLGFLSKYVSRFPDNVVCAFTSTWIIHW